MNRTLRCIVVAAVLFTMICAAAIAGGASEGKTTDKITLRVAWWGATGRNEKYLKIIEEYEARNPNITIVPEYQGWADYWSKMATLVAARNLPDVHQYTNNQLAEFHSKGATISLEPYIKDGTISLENWNMTMVDSGRIGNDLVAITIGITGPAMIINMSWAEELGIKIPPFDASFTWDEFGSYLEKDVVPRLPSGAYAFGDWATCENYFWTWIRQNEVEWLDASGKYAVPEDVLEGWYGLLDDYRKRNIAPPLAFTMEDSTKARGDNAFNRRRMLIRPTNANQAKLEQKYMLNPSDRVEFRRLPMIKGRSNPAECLITSALSIAANSKYKDEAAKYIDYFINDPYAQTVYEAEIGVPGSFTVQEMLKPKLDKVAAQEFDYINLISGGGVPPTKPKPAGIWAFDAEIQQMNQRVAAGEVTPAQAAKEIIDRANKFLASIK
jgi:multiple sugar transport system substrate-binding protein